MDLSQAGLDLGDGRILPLPSLTNDTLEALAGFTVAELVHRGALSTAMRVVVDRMADALEARLRTLSRLEASGGER